jgi:hypothetical protein
MTYFACFMVGSWMFVLGWYAGAIYLQNRNEKTESPQLSEKAERCPECQGWRLPAVAKGRAAAAD